MRALNEKLLTHFVKGNLTVREEKCPALKQLNGQVCYQLYKKSIENNGLIHSRITPEVLQNDLGKASKIGSLLKFLQSREYQTKTLSPIQKLFFTLLANKA